MRRDSVRRPPRDLWAIFGDIRSHARIDDAILSGAADIVRLDRDDIARIHEALFQARPIPRAICDRSALPLAGMASCIDDVQELAWRANAALARANDRLFAAQRLISDKETLYRLLEAQGIALPERILARNLDELERVLASLGAPLDSVILKPVVGTESRGVFRPGPGASPADVVAVLRELDDVPGEEAVLVMPFIGARARPAEFCLDGIVGARSVTFCAVHEKLRIHERYPIHDRAMIIPPCRPPDPAILNALLARFAGAFPLDDFVFHLEVRVDDDGQLVPIDLSFRPGGGLIFRSVLEVHGVDLRLAHMHATLGLGDALRAIARRAAPQNGSAAIAAVFSNGQPLDRLNASLSAMLAPEPRSGGLMTYDLSNVSILSAASQASKPDVGLCVTSALTGEAALAELDAIVERAGMTVAPAREARVPPPGRRSPEGPTVHALFSAQARRRPDAIALAHGDDRLSYHALDARSSRLARHLRDCGVARETPVGILLDRSPDAVIAMLATLKAGGCYVPLDPGFPPARLSQLARDAGVRHLLCRGAAAFDAYEGAILDIEALDQGSAMPAGAEEGVMDGANLAYILFTSGSTGRPKAVGVPHHAIANLVLGQRHADLEAATAILQAAPFSFDASTFELWGALLNGKTCVIHSEEVPSAPGLRETIERHGVDLAWFTASLFNMLVEDGADVLGALRCVIAGGETLSPRHVRRFQEQCPRTRLVNGYGPTETTTFACMHRCIEDIDGETAIPIGLPLANVELEILDARMLPVRPGESGELFIGGAGVARGYVNLPGLTAERFVPHPRIAGERLYRTGDRVRRRDDGALEFLGRHDRQIKLRGFRIELDEIEHALLRLPGVRAAAASVVAQGGDGQLAAAVVLGAEHRAGASAGDIRSALAERLPRFMIPERIELVDRLPVTAHGKRDRTPPAPRDTAPPGEDCAVTQALREIWREVLDIDALSGEDDFFERGGHSLSATRVAVRIRDRLGIVIGLRLLFENRRLADLAAALRRLMAQAAAEPPTSGEPAPIAAASSDAGASAPRPDPPLRKGAEQEGPCTSADPSTPMSFAQQRLWFLNALSNGADVSYNVPFALRLRGDLSLPALRAAFADIVARHETLRARFGVENAEPVQRIAGAVALDIALVDAGADEVDALVRAHARHLFDLERGPLIDVRVLRVGEAQHILLLNMHHIVADGWSVGVLVRELSVFYRRHLLGAPVPLAALPMRYADYAERQRAMIEGSAGRRQLDFWLQQLAGAPLLLELADRPRPARMSGNGGQARFAIPGEVRDQLLALSKQRGATLFMTLMAAFTTLLHRLSGQRDILVGTPIAGRGEVAFEEIIGCFVNTIVIRSRAEPENLFAGHLDRIREASLNASENQDVPFEVLVEHLQPYRSLSHTPVFQVMMALQNIPIGSFSLPGLTVEPVVQELATAKFDLNLSLAERPDEIVGVLEFNADIFDGPGVARFVEGFLAILGDLAVRGADVPMADLGTGVAVSAPVSDAQAAHWEKLIEGRAQLDFPREMPGQAGGAGSILVALPRAHLEPLRAFAGEMGAGVGQVLSAALAVLMFRLTQQSSFLFGLGPISAPGRARAWLGWHCVLTGEMDFRHVVRDARLALDPAAGIAMAVDAIRELASPPDGMPPTPLFSVSLGLDQDWPPMPEVSPFHCAIRLAEDEIAAAIEFGPEIGTSSNARRIGEMFGTMLGALLAAPGAPISTARLLTDAERAHVLHGLNPARTETVRENSLAAPFEACCARMPDAVALIGEDQTLTYRMLDQRASRLAHYLREVGVAEGGRVGIFLHRGIDMVVALYAAAKAGAAYVPIDPDLPDARVLDMIADAGVDCIVAQSAQAGRIAPGGAPVLDLDGIAEALRAMPETSIALRQPSTGIAYLMYTSGSTGRPKAVQFPIDAAILSIRWLQHQYPVEPGDHHLFKTPFGFDVSIWEIFWPLYHGGTLVVCDPDGHRDPAYLRSLIERHRVTCANFVPSMLQVMLDELPPASCPSLRWVLSGGEALSPQLRDRCHALLPHATLVNLYGPTETHSVTDIVVPRDPGNGFVPLGRPSAAYRLHVLDGELEPVPIGVVGELHIGGDIGVSHGYLGRPALTAERFVPDPFGSPGARMYRSGDVCRYYADGVLQHLGREDRQVKIRGVRIELGEIEAALLDEPGIRSVVAAAIGDGTDRQLAAFVVPEDGGIDASAVLHRVAGRLPRHMIPAAIVPLPAIPQSINGKVDHAALARLWAVRAEGLPVDAGAPALSDTEQRLKRLYEQILGRSDIDPERSFFEMGGHSMLAFRLTAACEREFGIVLSMQALFTHDTVRGLAREIETVRTSQRLSLVPMESGPEAGRRVVFLVHGADGTTVPLRHLAKALRGDCAVYGFQAPGLDDESDIPRSVQAYAERYVRIAEQVAEGRRIILAGWSYGGAVALEMARLWQEQGLPVEATILLDSFVLAPVSASRQGDADAGFEDIDFLGAGPMGEGVLLDRLASVLKANLRSFLRYFPERFSGRVELIKAGRGFPKLSGALLDDYDSTSRSWEHFLDYIATHEVDADHFDLLSEGSAEMTAKKMLNIMDLCHGA